MMTNKKLVGVRDPFGIRPLVIGKLKNFIFCNLKLPALICWHLLLERENGEIVIIENNELKISNLSKKKTKTLYF